MGVFAEARKKQFNKFMSEIENAASGPWLMQISRCLSGADGAALHTILVAVVPLGHTESIVNSEPSLKVSIQTRTL